MTFYFIHQKLLKVIKIRNPSLFMFSPRWEKIKVIIKFAFRRKVDHVKRPAVQSSSQQRSAAIFPGRLLKQQSHKRASFWLRWCRLRVPPSIHSDFFLGPNHLSICLIFPAIQFFNQNARIILTFLTAWVVKHQTCKCHLFNIFPHSSTFLTHAY